jgi:hypothetical protein
VIELLLGLVVGAGAMYAVLAWLRRDRREDRAAGYPFGSPEERALSGRPAVRWLAGDPSTGRWHCPRCDTGSVGADDPLRLPWCDEAGHPAAVCEGCEADLIDERGL